MFFFADVARLYGTYTITSHTPGVLPFPRWPSGLGILALLTACSPRADTFKPLIVITSPDGGPASAVRSFTVTGYVLADRGVRTVSVQGVPLVLPTSGLKIQAFTFRTLIPGDEADYHLQATDVSGNITNLTLPLRVDAESPRLTVSKVESSGGLLKITGVATDNQRVAAVIVNGNRLNINPSSRVEFYAETSGQSAGIEVRDAAGNVHNQRVP